MTRIGGFIMRHKFLMFMVFVALGLIAACGPMLGLALKAPAYIATVQTAMDLLQVDYDKYAKALDFSPSKAVKTYIVKTDTALSKLGVIKEALDKKQDVPALIVDNAVEAAHDAINYAYREGLKK